MQPKPKQQQQITNNTTTPPCHKNPNKQKEKKRNLNTHKKTSQQLCNKEELDEFEIFYSKVHALSLHSKVIHWKEARVLINWVASNQKANITASSK